MGFFDKHKHSHEDSGSSVATASAPPAPQASQVVDLGKRSGAISLEKGQSVTLEKKATAITASASWKSGTDYDVYALIGYADGHTETVVMFGTESDPNDWRQDDSSKAIHHMGDVGRDAHAPGVEKIQIQLNPSIVDVAIVAYSARSNGSGSFHRYKVTLEIDAHNGDQVTIDANKASKDDGIYTCVPGIIRNRPDGVVIEALEYYSRRGSEHRPVLRNGQVFMDEGPVNIYK